MSLSPSPIPSLRFLTGLPIGCFFCSLVRSTWFLLWSIAGGARGMRRGERKGGRGESKGEDKGQMMARPEAVERKGGIREIAVEKGKN